MEVREPRRKEERAKEREHKMTELNENKDNLTVIDIIMSITDPEDLEDIDFEGEEPRMPRSFKGITIEDINEIEQSERPAYLETYLPWQALEPDRFKEDLECYTRDDFEKKVRESGIYRDYFTEFPYYLAASSTPAGEAWTVSDECPYGMLPPDVERQCKGNIAKLRAASAQYRNRGAAIYEINDFDELLEFIGYKFEETGYLPAYQELVEAHEQAKKDIAPIDEELRSLTNLGGHPYPKTYKRWKELKAEHDRLEAVINERIHPELLISEKSLNDCLSVLQASRHAVIPYEVFNQYEAMYAAVLDADGEWEDGDIQERMWRKAFCEDQMGMMNLLGSLDYTLEEIFGF